MSSVHDATYEVLRAFGMTTIFGNRAPTNFRFSTTFHQTSDTSLRYTKVRVWLWPRICPS